MSSPGHPLRPAPWGFLLLSLWACHGTAPDGASTVSGKRYTVRAEVVSLPARPGGDLLLRHEAVPDFTDGSGAVVGMKSMVMPFPAPADVPLTGLAPGDKIEFVFSVDWTQGRFSIASLKKLPADTALVLGTPKAMAPMGTGASGPDGR